MKDFKQEIASLLAKQDLGLGEDTIFQTLEVPPNSDMGDYAFPCFSLARVLRKAPAIIAKELSEELQDQWQGKVEAKGPYVNFTISTQALAEQTITAIIQSKGRYGSSEMGKGKTVCIDFSSTNIAKPFHIGHIRSTVQGDAIASLYEYLGYQTVRINYLGDYGTQFGMLIHAYEMWGDEEALDEDPIRELLRLYVRYNEEAKDAPQLMEEARNRFYRLEQGEEAETSLWKRFKELSLREFQRVYSLLKIRFDSWDGEFYHSQFIQEVLDELERKKLWKEDDHAMIVDLGEDIPPALILKSNGSSTYITRDISTAIYRKKRYDFDENIYVVGTQQNLHFQQLKRVLAKMGYDWSDDVIHVPFGMISLEEGTMSTRSGNVVFLEDVLNGAIDKTRSIIEERNPSLENKEEVARQVGIGAVKFQELYNNRIKDYTFSWDEILNFDGETGPYVQYTIARAHSVMERARSEKHLELSDDVSFSQFDLPEEHELIKELYDFPGVIVLAKERKEPSLVTRQITKIAKSFNKFYNKSSVLNAESEEQMQARFVLVSCTKQVLETGLHLLGIETPHKM